MEKVYKLEDSVRGEDDFEINCTRCDNWESGTLKNLGTFEMEVI